MTRTERTPFRLVPHPAHNALYIHIPFCGKKCAYCDFFSLPAQSEETMRLVIDAIIREISWFQDNLSLLAVDSVFIGGGTPSVLPPRLLERLLTAVSRLPLHAQTEWTVEGNPESLTEDFLAIAGGAGVTRLSLGVQSFSGKLLRVLGRNTGPDQVRAACELLVSRWKGLVSLDLMYAVPGEGEAELRFDLASALSYAPGHLSAYSLAVEPGTPLVDQVNQGSTVPLGDDQEERLSEMCSGVLAESGFRRYEVSNYSLPGMECRHNLTYWRMEPYIGVGPGAVSTLPGEGGEVLRLEHTRSLADYFSRPAGDSLSAEIVFPRSFLLEHLMMGLRLTDGIARSVIVDRFGNDLESFLGERLEAWRADGFFFRDKARYACTEKGRRILNHLLREAAEDIERLELDRCVWPA